MPIASDDAPLTERLWDYVCPFQKYILVVAVVEVLLLLLLAFSLAVGVQPGTSSYYIVIVDIAVIVPTLLAAAYAYRRCQRRQRV
ncbi:hypothetical protein [Halosimplex amylolyticum]|uniref:hypothetical protein n=1 Tax=Halosimplex amylolyticum TaxID=3396616 RepID=UPI003F572CE4